MKHPKLIGYEYKAKNPGMPNTEFLGLRVPPELAQALEKEAKACGATLPEFLRLIFIAQTFHHFPAYRFDNSETIPKIDSVVNLKPLIPFFDGYFRQVKKYFEMVDKWRENIVKAEAEYQIAKKKLQLEGRKKGKKIEQDKAA